MLDRAEDPERGDLASRLREHLALQVRAAIDPDESRHYVEQVEAAEAAWTPNFGGQQFTLGRAWYTHLETDRSAEYFARAADSDRLVESAVPGLQARVLALAETVVREPIARRAGWCGPGVHVFTTGEHVSSKGGDVHYDVEGLRDEQLERRSDAYSFVLMLQPTERGGGLKLHDRMYAGDPLARGDGGSPSEVLDYGVGDLVVFDSYRLHQIQPFGGTRSRISATVHVARRLPGEGDGFEAWF